jgi:hypothetical protein
MRTLLLVLFEIAALFGIPRMVNEFRAAMANARPPVVAVSSAKESHPVSAATTKAVLVEEVAMAQLLQVSLQPSARTVANLQPPPQAHASAKEDPVKESAAAARDDDYLPPWMRGGSEATPVASQAMSVMAPVAAKKAGAAKQAAHKRRRGERGRDAWKRSMFAMDF